MPNFREINTFEKDKAGSFEDLVCILARRKHPEDDADFYSIDGRGGDGGVDALCITSDGRKIGYQAKYIFCLDNVRLRQMDRSVKHAVATHPELKKYVFAIPFDPTGSRGPNVDSNSQWEKWNKRVIKWTDEAAEKGIDLEFKLWTADTLTNMMLRDENAGLLRHWFNEEALNDAWFCQKVRFAIKRLGNRYSPTDHVGVNIEALFDTIASVPFTSEKITSAFERLCKAQVSHIELKESDSDQTKNALRKTLKAYNDLLILAHDFPQDLSTSWPISVAMKKLSTLKEGTNTLKEHYKSGQQKLKNDPHSTVKDDLHALSDACEDLESILGSRYIAAEEKRCCLLRGITGAGKSHLLAHVAEERVKQGFPTILLLGQDYSNLPFWFQTGKSLGLRGESSEDILGALDAVGLRKQQGVLLLVDAINEGIEFKYWRSQIPHLINDLKNYPHVAMVFSCREEYLPSDLHKSTFDDLPEFSVHGFSSQDERRNAAIQYLGHECSMDTDTSWCGSEFGNPLFLKIASEAIDNNIVSEFPSDFRGTSEIIGLYLNALSCSLDEGLRNAEGISRDIILAARKVAEKMAESGSDSLTIDDANRLVDGCFSVRTPPERKTWLQVLTEISLFRLDDPPFSKNVERLKPLPKFVRFTFQLIQDHLMATSLAEKIQKGHETNAFSPGGPLSFLLSSDHSGNELSSQFAGLVDALSVIFPEKFGLEFSMALPERNLTSDDNSIVRKGFANSLKRRKVDTFTEQTLVLINSIDGNHTDVLGSLLEVAMIVDHPCNALFLHEHLRHLNLPERDSRWTRLINQNSRLEDSEIERIISWSLTLPGRDAGFEELKLAAIVLTWSLSSSHRTLRDRATKALTTIFLADSDVFEFVARLAHDCDDPYVIERLYAAAFGACCLDQKPDRLYSYSKLVYELVFADGNPPVGLLVRDYALGVIELAEYEGALSNKVYLPSCYHPFSSDPPTFDLGEVEVEKIAEHAGDKQIFMSAAGEWGDYGKYSIPGRVKGFMTVSVREPRPLTSDELKEQFLADVINPFPERVTALNDLEALMEMGRSPQFQDTLSKSALGKAYHLLEGMQLDEKATQLADEHGERQKKAGKNLKQHLSEDEQKRLSSEYLREGQANKNDNRVSVDQCRLWITKRAYELGWTADLFPNDGEGAGNIRGNSDLERIGKKYQRIALDELQARLADNFWVFQDWSKEPTKYRYSHHDFRRNIDPTILPTTSRYEEAGDNELRWATQPEVSLPQVGERDLAKWPSQKDPTASFKSRILRTNENGERWLVLYEFSLDSQKHDDPSPAEHGTRYEEFRFIYCILTQSGKSAELAKHLNRKRSLDVSSFQPREFTDGPYLLEAHWRDTWQDQKFSRHIRGAPDGLQFATPVAEYRWESHLDNSLPEGFSRHLPQKWFADELGLKMVDRNANSWKNSDGLPVLTSASGSEGRSTVVVDERTFMDYASQFNMEPVWIMIAERNAWPRGKGRRFKGRRAEAVAWYDSGKLRKRGWKHDT